MNIQSIPNSIICDSNHAEITLLFLLGVITILGKLLWNAKKDKEEYIRINENDHEKWRHRIEVKLDTALSDHNKCRETLPERFVTVPVFNAAINEFKESMEKLSQERTKAWTEFSAKFDKHLDRFWNHLHDQNGKVERMP